MLSILLVLLASVLAGSIAPETSTADNTVTSGKLRKPAIVFPVHNGQVSREGAVYVTAAGEPCNDPTNCYEVPQSMEYCPVERPCSAELSASATLPDSPPGAEVDKAFELAKSEMEHHNSNACVEILVIEDLPKCVIRMSPSKRASGCAYRVIATNR